MRRCILHVGMHKTGTSSIQHSLAGFADANFFYHRDGKNHGRAILGLLGSASGSDKWWGRDTAKRTRAAPQGQPDESACRKFQETFQLLGHRALLLSGEHFVFLSTAELRKLQGILSEEGVEKIEAVAYVRTPAAYITSLVQQKVKVGTTHFFMLQDGGRLRLDREHCHYRRSFEKFDTEFGRENVHLWKFDPGSFPAGCVVRDFCSKLGIALPEERIVRVNESIPREAVALLYTYGKLGERFGSRSMRAPEIQALAGRLTKLGDTKFRLSPELLRPLLADNRADIEWMEARLGASLQEELGEHRAGDVRDEWDLLRPDPEVIGKLRAMLGGAAPKGVKGETPEEVAQLVHAVRLVSDEYKRKGRNVVRAFADVMPKRQAAQPPGTGRSAANGDAGARKSLDNLFDEMERSDPGMLNGLSRAEAQAFVRSAFAHMSGTLSRAEDSVIDYEGLGRFRVSSVAGGGSAQGSRRKRIGFRPSIQGRL
jgi:hypothetical protein